MTDHKYKSSALYVLKFIAFVLLFVFIGNSVAYLWRYIGKSTASALLTDINSVSSITVIIDAGHGGEDGGAVALSRLPEKDLNLDISLTLCDMLRSCGVNVILTRKDDAMLSCEEGSTRKGKDLAARRRIVEGEKNAIFVSIHMNSFALEKYSGLQVYYSENDPESKVLADKMQSYTRDCLQKSNDRKTKLGNDIYLLEKLKCPAVLVECGFLSNQAEAKLLNDSEYRQKLALVLCASICDFLCETANENA